MHFTLRSLPKRWRPHPEAEQAYACNTRGSKRNARTLQYRSSHSTSRAGWCAASLTSAAAIHLTDDAQGLRSDSLPVTGSAAMSVGALGLQRKRLLVTLQLISADEALTEYPATAGACDGEY